MTSKEWKKCKLGDIADVTKLAGFEFTKYINYDESGEIIALRALNLRNGILDLSDIKRIKKSVSDSLTRSKLYINDILLTYTGNGYGDCAIIKENDKYHLAPNICKISPKIEIVDPYYLYSYIRSKQFYTQMTNNMVGSGQPTIPMKTIRILEIPISSKNKQQKIAKVLSAIDDKIELNNSINNNLEQQAQAIFKSWFIDVSDSNNSSEKFGKFPQLATELTVGDIEMLVTDYVANGSFASLKENVTLYQEPNYAYFVRNTDLKTNTFNVFVDEHSYKFLSKSTLYGNEIIISNVGDVGSVFLCPKLDLPMTLGNNIIMLRPKDNRLTYYLYIWFKWSYGQNLIQGIKGGSAQPKFNKTDFKSLPIIIPQGKLLDKFSDIMTPIFNSIEKNNEENKFLIQLRDTLLPKLMSGEIDVSEVDISTDKLLFSEEK